MKTTGVTFNHVAKEIIITKVFEKAANKIGSTEYNELVKIRKDFPDYTIKRKEIEKNTSKQNYKGLTVKEMKRFIATRSEKEVALFERVCQIAESKQGKYAVIKKWFLDKYQKEYDKELENLKLVEEIEGIAAAVEESAETEPVEETIVEKAAAVPQNLAA